MLTKNLLRYKFRGNRIEPAFIDATNADLLNFADGLGSVFAEMIGETRLHLLEEIKPLIDGAPGATQIAKGIEKLLLDRTEFDTAPNEQLTALREEVFEASAALLRDPEMTGTTEYRSAVEATIGADREKLQHHLYGDLPDYQRITRFRPISAERLLHRYNSAQIQGLLMRSNQIELQIPGGSAGSLRQLFKYLRFQQLLADIVPSEDGYRITIDGPLNLFYQSQKYGLSLALFFPALLHQPRWSLRADIQMQKRRTHELSIDESVGIQPYSHRFLNYVPEEVILFQEMVHNAIEGWSIAPAENFLPLQGDFYCFPDFAMRHESGLEVALELFHPWHATHLTHRLEQVAGLKQAPLIIGVSRELLKNELVKDALDRSDYYGEFGFLFRSMPSRERLGKVLKLIANAQ